MSAKEKMEKAGDGGVEEMERQQVCNTSEPLLRRRERENTDISKKAQCMCVCEFSPSPCALLKKEKKMPPSRSFACHYRCVSPLLLLLGRLPF